MNTSLIEIGTFSLNGQQVLLTFVCLLVWVAIITLIKRSKISLFDEENLALVQATKRITLLTLHLILCYVLIHILKINFTLFQSNGFVITLFEILVGLYILQAIRYLDHFGVALVSSSDEQIDKKQSKSSSPTQLIHLILIGLAGILLVKNFDLDRGYRLAFGGDNEFSITPSTIITVILIILIARLLYWLVTNIVLQGFYNARSVEAGIRFALNRLLAYVVFTITALIALQSMGVNMGLIWAGAAALLVGVGIGLQQTFSDIFAGITLLFERSIRVGDVLAINGTKGTVKRIGLRTSIIVTSDKKHLIIPNSHLTNNDVNNWSKNSSGIRHSIEVGVAYGTDTSLVKRLLLDIIESTTARKSPSPLVRFDSFGDSALLFSIHFYSKYYIDIEDLQSDIRFKIDEAFKAHNITIPFPQRDVWIRKEEEDKTKNARKTQGQSDIS